MLARPRRSRACQRAGGGGSGRTRSADRDRLARRLLHLGRGRPLAGQHASTPSRDRDGTDRARSTARGRLLVRPGRVYGAQRRQRLPPLRRRRDQERRASPCDQKVNLACSGADDGEHLPRVATAARRSRASRRRATSCAYVAQALNVKLVVLSIGGNDLGFADIVQACATGVPEPPRPALRDHAAAGGRRAQFPAAMRNRRAGDRRDPGDHARRRLPQTDYRLILQSYPSVVPRGSENRYPETDRGATRRHRRLPVLRHATSTWARDSVVTADRRRAPVRRGARRASQFLDLRDALQGREICAKTTAQAVAQPAARRPTTSEWGRFINESTVDAGRAPGGLPPERLRRSGRSAAA